jgi:Protein of unknown function (DUF4019)
MNLMRWLAAGALLTLTCSAAAQLKPSTSKPPLTPQAAPSAPKAEVPAKAGSVEEAKEAAAQAAAEKWLALLDRGEFGKAWDECAQLFRERVTREQWVDGLPATRKPFGAMKSRRFEIAVYKTELQGAPDGEYVTARFITTFEKKEAEELLTLALENGAWRTTGYLIK